MIAQNYTDGRPLANYVTIPTSTKEHTNPAPPHPVGNIYTQIDVVFEVYPPLFRPPNTPPPRPLYPGVKNPGTHRAGGWVTCRVGLDVQENSKTCCIVGNRTGGQEKDEK
jgi:hypothetical protein